MGSAKMERRYDLLHKVGFRDITGYNKAVDEGTVQPGLGEVDEHGSHRVQAPAVHARRRRRTRRPHDGRARDVEESIARIAQMARAVGIHLVIATQRPSVNVITGVIKANVPRVSPLRFRASPTPRILDQPGAERLVGKGDLLMLAHRPRRRTVCRAVGSRRSSPFDREALDRPGPRLHRRSIGRRRHRHRRRHRGHGPGWRPIPAPEVTSTPPSLDITAAPPAADEDGDELLGQAMELVVETHSVPPRCSAQAPGRFRPRRPHHGSVGGGRCGRPLHRFEGP